MMKSIFSTLCRIFLNSLVISLFMLGYPVYSQSCNCNEYIYLNEPTSGGAVHKYLVNNDGTLTEIGAPWFDSANQSPGNELPSPHGLGTDLNGFVYIGETFRNDGDIRKLTCDGTILPESEFVVTNVNGSLFNLTSIGETAYYNTNDDDITIKSFNICDGQPGPEIQYCEQDFNNGSDWGLFANKTTGEFYATGSFSSGGPNYFWYFNESDFDNNPNTCISAIPLSNDFPNQNADVRGVVTDNNNNVYIAVRNDGGDSYLLKYGPAPNFNYIGTSAVDSAEDGTGFRFIIGLAYSETSNSIYASTESPMDDCISIFDTNLNYLGAAVPPAGTGDNAKGIAVTKECCPINNTTVIDTSLCDISVGDILNVQDLIDCNGGPICEGSWAANPSNTSLAISCSLSQLEVLDNGCSEFTLSSDASSPVAQCSEPFTLQLNVCVNLESSPPAISITDNTCSPDVSGSINVDTPCVGANTIEFSTDGGANWSATPPAYDEDNSITVRARCVGTASSCISTETADISTNPEECCPPENCISQFGEFIIQKNEP